MTHPNTNAERTRAARENEETIYICCACGEETPGATSDFMNRRQCHDCVATNVLWPTDRQMQTKTFDQQSETLNLGRAE